METQTEGQSVLNEEDDREKNRCLSCGHLNPIDKKNCEQCKKAIDPLLSGLDRMRNRLLDLTNRNKLLNFRHTKRSSLRLIDVSVNKLHQMLLDEEVFTFKAIPQPIEAEYEPEGFEEKPTAEEWAKHLDIPADYNLQAHHHQNRKSLNDPENSLQALLYSQDLEANLKRIKSLAQTAIEESGTNMLYLAFGFLEWYDSDSSDTRHHAPLILIPVVLEKTRRFQGNELLSYKLSISAETITPNLSLKEKLALDFGIELPDLEEEESPESYFRRLEFIFKEKPKWKLKRYITLSLFHFGKLLMYLDLDPSNWPGNKKITKHDLIGKFFKDGGGSGNEVGEEYDIDSYDNIFTDFPLIDDADSSQHSALIDAVSGKNLVIEGPPGTGKSQTITNLIAAALNKDKSVLFISEKLAALEVVRRRLDNANLGDFCLELHSHKTQKRQLIDDIGSRLDKKGHYDSPRELERKIDLLEKSKQKLKEYADLINQVFLNSERPIQKILCSAIHYNKLGKFDYRKLEPLKLANTQDITPAFIEINKEKLEVYFRSLKVVHSNCESIYDHPWYGFTNTDLIKSTDQDYLKDSLENWKQTTLELIDLNTKISDLLSTSELSIHHLRSVEELISLAKKVPNPESDICYEMLPRLKSGQNTSYVKEFLNNVEDLKKDEQEISLFFQRKEIPIDSDFSTIGGSVGILEPQLTSSTSLDELEEGNLKYTQSQQLLEELKEFLEQLADVLYNRIQEISLTELRNIVLFIELCQEAPLESLQYRNPLFEADGLLAHLEKLHIEINRLNTNKSDLSEHFDLNFLPSNSDLNSVSEIILTSGFFKWLSPSWRRAQRICQAFTKNKKKINNSNIDTFKNLVQFANELEKFSNDKRSKSLLGDYFDSLETPIDDLIGLKNWYDHVHEKTGFGISQKSSIADLLFTVPISRFKGLQQPQASIYLNKIKQLDSHLTWLIQFSPSYHEDLNLYTLDQHVPIEAIQHTISVKKDIEIPGSKTLSEILNIVTQYKRTQSIKAKISEDKELKGIIGEGFLGVESDLSSISKTLLFCETVLSTNVLPQIANILLGFGQYKVFEDFLAIAQKIATKHDDYKSYLAEFIERSKLNERHWFLHQSDPSDMSNVVERTDIALNNHHLLKTWLSYIIAIADIKSEETFLSELVELVESGEIDESDIFNAFYAKIYNELADNIFRRYPQLKRFNANEHELMREKFVKLDKEINQLTQLKIAFSIDKKKVPAGINSARVYELTELALLHHETNKKTRHVPIRKLLQRSGKALKALKPCFMMGPLSVAQYLAPGKLEFDLLVIDEASQLKPEDAVGAMARAKQLIVVGDPKQLPPTNFFNRLHDEEEQATEEEKTGIEESESILDAAIPLFRPIRRLKWHYRSQHPSLIQFSNVEFYDGSLVVFPSPNEDDPDYGVSLRSIKNGRFLGRKNEPEARHIAQVVIDHMIHNKDETLGVVAMNITQKELIEEEVDRLLSVHPEAKEFEEAKHRNNERFFVKNLENVQGDERDVIFISMTYGPDKTGKVAQRFFPINTKMGWRRLNVLFTRARKRIEVFSSMKAEDIKVSPNSARGVSSLRNYLHFAKTGKTSDIKDYGTITNKEPDSEFEVSVISELKNLGYNCEPQVGVDKFFIDLAVYHPDFPDTFILGVECDGAPYHSGKSVRDRDRLRESVLTGLGWNIHRIWSTDWYRNPEAEIKKLDTKIRKIQEKERKSGKYSKYKVRENSNETETIPDLEKINIEPEEENTFQPKIVDENIVELNDTVSFFDINEPEVIISNQIVEGKGDPGMGVLGEHMPLAQALLEAELNDEVELKLSTKKRTFKITEISKSIPN